ncbi:hypothetical protein [Peribacillus sp. AS_2]|uniref:hypothetical protein n=1 Tax=Peribacillus sp. AS_2 TaxID=2996755 RepID=UPI0022A72048|nr:hypothetical protein [Peribacillus sp. AS_2]MCZ0872757.1 hypothetical protein [Peribacillus sp. AS_2]
MIELVAITGALKTLVNANTASVVFQKVGAAKANRDKDKTIQELEQIINELINEKSELIRISNALEDELITKKISSEDIDYISKELLPILEAFLNSANTDSTSKEGQMNTLELINLLQPLLSKETFNILQALGFNFKEAIGEPLTILVKNLISGNSGNKKNSRK